MKVSRIGVKIPLDRETRFDPEGLIPVFHSWIQNQVIEEHLLIDVHNYSHVFRGPGILLIGHEGDFSLDQRDGIPGLLYQCKNRVPQPLEKCLLFTLRFCLKGCSLLENERLMDLKFDTSRIEVEFRDRLNLPNLRETAAEVEEALVGLISRWGFGSEFRIDQPEKDEAGPLRFLVHLQAGGEIDSLLNTVSSRTSSQLDLAV